MIVVLVMIGRAEQSIACAGQLSETIMDFAFQIMTFVFQMMNCRRSTHKAQSFCSTEFVCDFTPKISGNGEEMKGK